MNKNFVSKLASMTGGLSAGSMEHMLPVLEKIRSLKKEKNAVVLSHYYMPPELQILASQGGIADFVGDSLGLSIEASKTKADAIIFCGVEFMAETAKILNPQKKVLIPDPSAGCSLASSIKAEDVKALKAKYPGVPVMVYINTYAETKAECDICCTSRNALNIAASFSGKELIFIPDKYMGMNLQKNLAKHSDKKLILWNGACEVHEQFSGNISQLATANPTAEVLLHWEVPSRTVASSLKNNKGMVGSTTDIINYVGASSSDTFILGSECDLGAALMGLYPSKKFITPCIVCPHMKKITLYNTLKALEALHQENESLYRINLEEQLLERAYLPIRKMLDFA